MLAQAIDERLKNWGNGRRTGNRGTLTDLVRVEAKLATVPPPLPELKKRKLIGGAPKTPTDTSTNTDSTSDAKSDTETYKDSDSPPKKKTKLTKGVENTEEPVSATKTTKKDILTRYHRITSRTARRAGKSKFWLSGIAITQCSHILKNKMDRFVS